MVPVTRPESRKEQLLRLADEAEERAATRGSSIDRNDDLEEARQLRLSAGVVKVPGTEVLALVPDRSCTQCGKDMNPAEWILGPVCGRCCRANHRAATGRR